MNVIEMVRKYIEDQGLDGLCNGACGCGLDDFAPCGDGPYPDCVAAKKQVMPEDRDLRDPDTGELISCPDASPGDDIFVPARVNENSA